MKLYDLWIRFLSEERPFWLRLLVAVMIAGLTLLLTYALTELGAGQIYSINLIGVMFSAFYGGGVPALITAAISALTVDFFFIEPDYQFFTSLSSTIRTFLYFLTAVLMGSLIAFTKRSIEELNRAEAEAKQASQARENVIGIVSHDLKTPLTAISANAEFLRRRSEPVAARSVQLILDSADQMKRLIDDLFDAVQIEHGRFKLQLTECSVHEVLERTAALFSERAKHEGVRLRVHAPQGLPPVPCDTKRVIQALGNYVSNALRHAPAGSEILISAALKSDRMIRLSVIDHGPGVGNEDPEKLFVRFWQGKFENRRGGAGLGLFIVRGITESHHGRVGVDTVRSSSDSDKQTQFWLEIPIKKEKSGAQLERGAS